MIFVDYQNITYINLFAGLDALDIYFAKWKEKMVEAIMKLKTRFPGEKIVFCIDSTSTWRRKVYDQYKANRQAARDVSPVDFKVFFPIKDKFTKQLMTIFNQDYWIHIDEAEADDIIAVLSTYIPGEHTIVSTDRDFIQLLKHKNIKLYNPITTYYRESLDPALDLLVKIFTGDKSDNIPQLIPRVGQKKALKYIDKLDETLKDPVLAEAFERNCQLIDFQWIPVHISLQIKNEYESIILGNFNRKQFVSFLLSVSMKLITKAERWCDIMEV